jgi:hypothetical protein
LRMRFNLTRGEASHVLIKNLSWIMSVIGSVACNLFILLYPPVSWFL